MNTPPIKRRIMKEFRITEISGCDLPAQEGALVAIVKSANPPRVEQTNMQEQTFTKAEASHAIDALASAYARDNQMTFEAAYAELLSTDIGSKLYSVYKAAPVTTPLVRAPPYGGGQKAPLTPEGKKAIADGLEATAREKARLSGKSMATEYAALLDSPHGRAMYNDIRPT